MMKNASKLIVSGAALLALCAYGVAAPASESEQTAAGPVAPVALTGQRTAAAASDREVTQRVRKALIADPYVYAEHISVSTDDGVVTLDGLVASEWDLVSAIRISSRVPGVKHVVDDLQIIDFGRRG
jgi:hyperosmotically inducible protein